jgi:hypothetical protein
MKTIFPDTVARVQLHTDGHVNIKIKEQILDNICSYRNKSKEEIINRIKELDAACDSGVVSTG